MKLNQDAFKLSISKKSTAIKDPDLITEIF